MLTTATVSQIRAAEEPLLAAGVPLMQTAAHAVALAVENDGFSPPASVALLIGAGNNGGDALWAGSFLAQSQYQVTAYLLADGVHQEGLAALLEAGGHALRVVGSRPSAGAASTATPTAGVGRVPISARTIAVETPAAPSDAVAALPTVPLAVASAQVAHTDVVIDGILGIGASGGLRGAAGELVTALNASGLGSVESFQSKPWVIAVDCPSGITLDGVGAGQVPGPVLAADHTLTFGALKPGLVLPPASHLVGELTVVNMGFDLPPGNSADEVVVKRLTAREAAALIKVPGPTDQKYSRGVVGVVAGATPYPGAAVLCTSAAVNSGAGMVRYLGPGSVAQLVVAAQPEVVPGGGQVQAWVLGPGVPSGNASDQDDGQRERIRAALSQAVGGLVGVDGAVPAVVDAGALPMVQKPLPPSVVITPHAGELAALLSARGVPTKRSEVEANPLAAARKAQQLTGATVLLKGSTTLVVGPGNIVYSQNEAPNWLATAGAGDVLAGLLGTMLAARSAEVMQNPKLAAPIAAAAAYLHGTAAAQVNPNGPITAGAVAKQLPRTIAEVLQIGPRPQIDASQSGVSRQVAQ